MNNRTAYRKKHHETRDEAYAIAAWAECFVKTIYDRPKLTRILLFELMGGKAREEFDGLAKFLIDHQYVEEKL